VYRLTRVRLRQQPMLSDRVRVALAGTDDRSAA
jgi:hypothetical protein